MKGTLWWIAGAVAMSGATVTAALAQQNYPSRGPSA